MKLLKINPVVKRKSWDIEVENANNFYANGILVHNSNGAIVKHLTSRSLMPEFYTFQSKERELGVGEDNAGFKAAMLTKDYESLFNGIDFKESCAIFGEWCGGNIQAKVALNQLPKMFVIFAIKIDGVYQDLANFKHIKNEAELIYNILDFPTYSVDIDFNHPELIQNKLIELALAVEAECPVAKQLGATDIGEGVVLECFVPEMKKRYIMKIKGKKHQNSHVKTLTTVDVEAVENLNAFIEYAVTENRMMQGIDKMVELGLPLDLKSTSEYLRWVYGDVVKEESDTMIANGIDPKKVGGAISAKARVFWMNYLQSKT